MLDQLSSPDYASRKNIDLIVIGTIRLSPFFELIAMAIECNSKQPTRLRILPRRFDRW
jgi:hypothetical protein